MRTPMQPVVSPPLKRHHFWLTSLALTWCLSGLIQAQTPVALTVTSGGGTISTYNGAHTGEAGTNNIATGGFAVQITAISGTAVSLAPHATFCTELGEGISFTSYTAFEVVQLHHATQGTAGRPGTASASIPLGGIGAQAAAEMRYLFDQYYLSETLADWTVQQSQAFQLAVWEIGHDPGNLNVLPAGGGVFYVPVQNNGARDAAIALTQTMLDAVAAANVSTSYASTTVDVWSLADDNGINPTTGYQDILFATFKTSPDGQTVAPLLPIPVPEPTTLALLLGLGAVGLMRRRRMS